MLRAPGKKPVLIKPFNASAGVKAWYRRALAELVKEMHDEVMQQVLEVWKEQPPEKLLAHDESAPEKLQRVFDYLTKKFQERFNELSHGLARTFAFKAISTTERQMRAAFAKKGFELQFRPTKSSVEAVHAAIAENVSLIRSIPPQYFKDIQTQVWQSVMKGGDLHTLTQNLRKVHGISYRRAETIARDQTNKAKAVTETIRRLELGLTQARWLHSGKGKQKRKSHVAFSGHIFDLKKGAYLDGKWVWPGSEINCGCTSSVIVPGFDD